MLWKQGPSALSHVFHRGGQHESVAVMYCLRPAYRDTIRCAPYPDLSHKHIHFELPWDCLSEVSLFSAQFSVTFVP